MAVRIVLMVEDELACAQEQELDDLSLMLVVPLDDPVQLLAAGPLLPAHARPHPQHQANRFTISSPHQPLPQPLSPFITPSVSPLNPVDLLNVLPYPLHPTH